MQAGEVDTGPVLEAWLRQVMDKGFDSALVAEAMMEDGHPESVARALAALAALRAGPASLFTQLRRHDLLELASALYLHGAKAQEALSLPAPANTGKQAQRPVFDPSRITHNRLQLPDREVQVRVVCQTPRMAVFDDFLSHDECDELVALGRDDISPDRVVGARPGAVRRARQRSSHGVTLLAKKHAVVDRVGRRVAALVERDVSTIEALRLSRYLSGQQFIPHWDYFDPELPSIANNTRRGGQRIATVLLYLCEPDAAGGTLFPMAGLDIRPCKGAATYFAYQRGDGLGEVSSLHAGAPVATGEKWIATFWVREGTWATGRGSSVR